MLKHICRVKCMKEKETDEKFCRSKLPKFQVGTDHFVRRKMLSAEIFIRQRYDAIQVHASHDELMHHMILIE